MKTLPNGKVETTMELLPKTLLYLNSFKLMTGASSIGVIVDDLAQDEGDRIIRGKPTFTAYDGVLLVESLTTSPSPQRLDSLTITLTPRTQTSMTAGSSTTLMTAGLSFIPTKTRTERPKSSTLTTGGRKWKSWLLLLQQ